MASGQGSLSRKTGPISLLLPEFRFPTTRLDGILPPKWDGARRAAIKVWLENSDLVSLFSLHLLFAPPFLLTLRCAANSVLYEFSAPLAMLFAAIEFDR